ncbi:MAG: FGGY family carbohydrate kinase [Eubacteriales bacterium]
MSVLVSVDVGTTNLKAAAFDVDGNLISLKKMPSLITYGDNDEGYIDPELLFENIASLLCQLTSEVGSSNVTAISVAGMGEAIVPIDKDGHNTYPVIAWFDMRSRDQVEFMLENISNEQFFSITGLECHPMFSLSKMLWIKSNHPEVYEKSVMWLPVASYILYRLSGEAATDFTLASRTLMLDIHNCKWSKKILDTFNIDKNTLPKLVDAGTLIGSVTHESAKKTGLKAGTPVVMGGHDHPCTTIPAGILLSRRLLDSSGTAESALGILNKGATPPTKYEGVRINRHLDSSRIATSAGIISSGSSLDWSINQLASLTNWGINSKISYEGIMAKVVKVPPGSGGAMFMPHIRGAGAPFRNPASKGAFVGLRSSHTQVDLIRAVIEGLCFELKTIVIKMEEVGGITYDSVATVSGASKIALWQQIKASVIGKPIMTPEITEATALGAAMLAGIGVKIFKDMREASAASFKPGKVYEPDVKIMRLYEDLYQIYKNLYPSLLNINSKIDALIK